MMMTWYVFTGTGFAISWMIVYWLTGERWLHHWMVGNGGESDVCGAGWVLVSTVDCVCVCGGGGGGVVDRVGWYWWWLGMCSPSSGGLWQDGCVCRGGWVCVCVWGGALWGDTVVHRVGWWCLGWVVGGACIGGWVGVRVLGWVEECWMNEQCVVGSLRWCVFGWVDGWGMSEGAIGCAVEWVDERMIEWAE